MRGFPTACTTPAVDGMNITTHNKEINRLRKNVLELILSEHPHECIVCNQKELCEKYNLSPTKAGRITGCNFCPNRGRCELQKVAEYLGIKEIKFPFLYKNLPVERYDPFFERDYNLCILCGRCVRVCSDIRGIGAIAFINRGHDAKIGTAFDKSHLEGGCQFCGACVDVCPTGALSARASKWHGVPEKTTATTCALCSVGCRLNLETKWGKIMGAKPDDAGPANNGQACARGRFSIPTLVNDSERVKYPLVRKQGRLVPATWEQAIQMAADRLVQYSSEETGFLASSFMTNEAAYLLQKFARAGTGTNNIDVASFSAGRLVDTQVECTGVGASAGTFAEIDNAGWILTVGTDILVSHPVLMVNINRARKQGAAAFHIGPSLNSTGQRLFDNNITVKPSEYLPLVSAVLKKVLKNIHPDKDFSHYYSKDFDLLKKSLKNVNVSKTSRLCGVSLDVVNNIASLIQGSEKGCILYGSEVFENNDSRQIIMQLFNLLLLTGNPSGLVALRDEGNSQGVCDMGALPGYLPGYQNVSSKAAIKKVEKIWSVSLPRKSGMNCNEMLRSADQGNLKAVYLTGDEIIEKNSFNNLDFLILHAVFPSPLFDKADIVFPCAAFTEEDGTITSSERRVQKLSAGAKPPSMALPEWKIISMLAECMKYKGFSFSGASEIFNEICKVNSLISGQGIWPVKPVQKYRLKPLVKTDAPEEEFGSFNASPWRYRGIDLIKKVPDLKILYDKISEG
jgi:predicted molibdopterin-dependent oxidoreductase YjgC